MRKLEEMTDEERWQLFPIILSPYQSSWLQAYRFTKDDILSLCSDMIARITHIGSTAVPGMLAKPTIDILIELKDHVQPLAYKESMLTLGFRCSNHVETPDFSMMFLKGYTEKGFEGQVYHVHVRQLGDWGELYFCEYLRLHPDVATAYADLKKELKQSFEHHRDNYTNGKTAFIKKHTLLAREQLNHKYDPKKKG